MSQAKVIWTDEAIFDLELIYDFIALKSIRAAKKTVDSLLLRTRQLENFPTSGPVEMELLNSCEYRYLIQSHFKLIYSVRSRN